MYMSQLLLVHQSETSRHCPCQEDTTRRVLSSMASDSGIYSVIREPQEGRAMYQMRPAMVLARLGALLRQVAAKLSVAAWGSDAGSQGPSTQGTTG